MTKQKLCPCGCGQSVKPGNKYAAPGHNSRTPARRKFSSLRMKQTLREHPEIVVNLNSYNRTDEARLIHSNTMSTTHREHPTLGQERNADLVKWQHKHPRKAHRAQVNGGLTIGSFNVENGTIDKALKASIAKRRINHIDGFHMSKAELKRCIEVILPKYGSRLHSNVKLGRKHIDWVVSKSQGTFNPSDPSTWERVIEYHPYDYKGIPLKVYRLERIRELRMLGITCPIEVQLK